MVLAFLVDLLCKIMKCLMRVISKEEELHIISADRIVFVKVMCSVSKKEHGSIALCCKENRSKAEF